MMDVEMLCYKQEIEIYEQNLFSLYLVYCINFLFESIKDGFLLFPVISILRPLPELLCRVWNLSEFAKEAKLRKKRKSLKLLNIVNEFLSNKLTNLFYGWKDGRTNEQEQTYPKRNPQFGLLIVL